MKEAEWLARTAPERLLMFLERVSSERKTRLLISACCRRIWDALGDLRSRTAVEVAERLADGLAPDPEVAAAREGVRAAARAGGSLAAVYALYEPALASPIVYGPWYAVEALQKAHPKGRRGAVGQAERAEQVRLIRDIYGNPFRPVALNPTWLTSTVTALANGIYQDRAFDRLPILADALQDGGCESDDILQHCRDAHAVHARGCWVVDLLTGRS